MNPKHLLVTSIVLLFRESQQTNLTENSSELVRQVISEVKLPDHALTLDEEKGILNNLISTAHMMCGNSVKHLYDAEELLQRLRLDCGEDQTLYKSFEESISSELDDLKLKARCLNLKRSLKEYFDQKKVNDIINKASYSLKFKPEEIPNLRSFVEDVSNQLEKFRIKESTIDPAVISIMDFDNPDTIKVVAEGIKNREEGGSYLKTGFQLINRQTGGLGLRRGELVVVNALQHNYKSGLTRAIFASIAMCNTPVAAEGKKPLLSIISFEDTNADIFEYLYKFIYENETKKVADLSLVSIDEMINYVISRLKSRGWHIDIRHVNPYVWSYRNLCDYVIEKEAEGYEMQLCCVDYLMKLPTIGCDGNAAGEALRNLFERTKAFFQAKNITLMTPHQISTDAKLMIREGRNNFVKELPGRGYYAGSKQLDQVFDLEFFIHIEHVNGKAYLTVQRGKHRKVEQTAMEHLYGVLPFNECGPLLMDIDGKDLSLKAVGGGPIGSGEEVPFWMNN